MNVFKVSKLLPIKTAYAHCDIPCGIYDPHNAQVGAHTVIRMTQLLVDENDPHAIARLTHVKEEHGELIEKELVTLAYDYFKNEHYKKFNNLETLFDDAIELSVKTRQNIDLGSAKELLEKTMQIAEIFYKTKNVEYKRVKSVYPTNLEIVVPA